MLVWTFKLNKSCKVNKLAAVYFKREVNIKLKTYDIPVNNFETIGFV